MSRATPVHTVYTMPPEEPRRQAPPSSSNNNHTTTTTTTTTRRSPLSSPLDHALTSLLVVPLFWMLSWSITRTAALLLLAGARLLHWILHHVLPLLVPPQDSPSSSSLASHALHHPRPHLTLQNLQRHHEHLPRVQEFLPTPPPSPCESVQSSCSVESGPGGGTRPARSTRRRRTGTVVLLLATILGVFIYYSHYSEDASSVTEIFTTLWNHVRNPWKHQDTDDTDPLLHNCTKDCYQDFYDIPTFGNHRLKQAQQLAPVVPFGTEILLVLAAHAAQWRGAVTW